MKAKNNNQLVSLSKYFCNKERNEIGAELDSHELVNNLFKKSKLNKLIGNDDDIMWTGDAETYFEGLGYEVVTSGNTYNHESDLTDIMQWSLVQPKGSKGDGLYNDENAIILIQFHHGGDARGNYGKVVAYDWQGEDSFNFLDTCVGWSFASGKDSNGEKLSTDQLQKLDERYQVGYTANPTYNLNKEIEKVIKIDLKNNKVKIKLKSGETVEAYPNHRAE